MIKKAFYDYRTTPSLKAPAKLFVARRNGHFISLPWMISCSFTPSSLFLVSCNRGDILALDLTFFCGKKGCSFTRTAYLRVTGTRLICTTCHVLPWCNSWVLSEKDWFDFGHYLLIDKRSVGALLIPQGVVLKMEDMFFPTDIDAIQPRSKSTNVCVESTQSWCLVSSLCPGHSLRSPITKECAHQACVIKACV